MKLPVRWIEWAMEVPGRGWIALVELVEDLPQLEAWSRGESYGPDRVFPPDLTMEAEGVTYRVTAIERYPVPKGVPQYTKGARFGVLAVPA